MYISLQLLLNLALFTSILFLIQKKRTSDSKQPPGPPRLPVIGNLHQFTSSSPHLSLHELSKNYGPLMSLKLGFTPTLVVSSAKMAKEVMRIQDHAFCSRPSLTTQQKLSYNGLDVAFSQYGEYWREARKLCALHLFSSKKVKSFSFVREEEVNRTMQEISRLSNEGKVVDLSEMMMDLTSSVICRIAFGRRFDGVNAGGKRRSFQDMLKDTQEMIMSFCFSDYFHGFGWVDKLTGMSSRLHKVFLELDNFYEGIIEEHLKEIGPISYESTQSRQEDIVDVLLNLQREKSLSIDITTNHIKAILMNIFVGATETSAATVVWVMTELTRNPKAMKRVQEEARALMGNESKELIKSEQHFEKLEYLNAVIKETMRMHPITPLLLPRETTQKCTIGGYEIQEKTLVYVNTWTIVRDPDLWENPDEFVPERFLNGNKSIDFRGQDFELTPFGSGRRICPGMQMGMALVELTLVNLVCLFDWALPEGIEEQVLDTSSLPGVAARKKFPLCLVAITKV